MLNHNHTNRAVVTVTNEVYLEGTKVLFYSFLKHNPDYTGDLVVIHDKISLRKQSELKRLFPVQFHQISESLKNKLHLLVNELQYPTNNLTRFWSIESLNLKQYQQLVFLDSDILVRGNILELFNQKAWFSACGDQSTFQNKGRDGETFLQKDKERLNESDFDQVFNAGVFSLNRNKEIDFKNVIDLISPHTFQKVKSGHTDQFVLNLYFKNKVNYLSQRFNYILKNSENQQQEETHLSSALIWHYTRHPKPWKFKELLKKSVKGKVSLHNYREWHLNYREVLKSNFRFREMKSWIISKLLFK